MQPGPQGESIFLNPEDNPLYTPSELTRVALIYFATNERELDDDDRRVLDRLKRYYSEERLRDNHVFFSVVGYADWRPADNLGLSQERARSVRRFLDSTIGQYPNITEDRLGPGEPDHREHETNCINAHYHCTSQGNGASGDRLQGITAAQLNRFRVAEVHARMERDLPPPPPPPNPTPDSTRIRLARSTHFKIRMLQGRGADIPFTPLSGNWNAIEIVDVQNNIRRIYEYKGGGFGISLPVNWSGSSSWVDVYTYAPLSVSHFGGPTIHGGFGRTAPNYSEDRFILIGPVRYGSDTVILRFRGQLGESLRDSQNIGGGIDFGVLQAAHAATTVPPDYTANSESRLPRG
jgi:hypothetical protein